MLGTCRTALGDVDRFTAPFFDAGLRDAIDHADENLVRVDLSRVRFHDSSGYRVLLGATAYAIRRGRTLVLHDLSSSCAKSIRTCDVNHELRVERAQPTSATLAGGSTQTRRKRRRKRQA